MQLCQLINIHFLFYSILYNQIAETLFLMFCFLQYFLFLTSGDLKYGENLYWAWSSNPSFQLQVLIPHPTCFCICGFCVVIIVQPLLKPTIHRLPTLEQSLFIVRPCDDIIKYSLRLLFYTGYILIEFKLKLVDAKSTVRWSKLIKFCVAGLNSQFRRWRW